MKANKRIRDPRRRSKTRLVVEVKGVEYGVTTMPTLENLVRRVKRGSRA